MKRTLLHYAEKLKKPLHILTAFTVIICTAFTVPAFAYSSDWNNSHVEDEGTAFCTQSGNLVYVHSSNDTTFIASVNRQQYFLSNEPFTYYFNSDSSNPISATLNSTYNVYQGWYYGWSRDPVSDIPVFTSTSAMFTDFNEFIIDYVPESSAFDFETTVEVPSGSVAYIGIPSSGSLSIIAKTTMPMYTSIGSNTWSNVPQRVKQVSSLPNSTTTFPLAGSAIPNWTKTEPYNWLNQSKSAVTSTTSWSGSNGNFLTFYNPVYYMDGSIQASTNTVYLTISGYSSIRIYPLQNDMSITAGSTSTSPTDYDGYWDATITDNGDGTGSVTYNPSEGSNLPPTPTSNQYNTGTSSSIIDYINQINQTLTNFAESFINLLKAPVAHIQQLVSAGSDFVSQLSSLYSWLPAEVYNTLTSAIILCISVGVLKVLL